MNHKTLGIITLIGAIIAIVLSFVDMAAIADVIGWAVIVVAIVLLVIGLHHLGE